MLQTAPPGGCDTEVCLNLFWAHRTSSGKKTGRGLSLACLHVRATRDKHTWTLPFHRTTLFFKKIFQIRKYGKSHSLASPYLFILFDPNLNLLNLRSLMDDIASKLKTWGPGAPQTKCSGALEERVLKARAMWDLPQTIPKSSPYTTLIDCIDIVGTVLIWHCDVICWCLKSCGNILKVSSQLQGKYVHGDSSENGLAVGHIVCVCMCVYMIVYIYIDIDIIIMIII